ncbi:hypothetical protein EXE58_05860 [Nocardioides seonyuensis]|uniref:Uncharacterized protein n=1 Tax=Nocardioides seonyuensis TaxID=2518371 RepID=A0A4P7ID07_9ACTN|nr:hypothetical protein [Nocardioides seonyuensis]QBX55024.1 hypothetical protein EXE58_05860 [Nocardioides seonyuensis]
MTTSRVLLAVAAAALTIAPLAASGGTAETPAPAAVRAGAAACPVFPDDNWWHADISSLPVHAESSEWLSHMDTDVDLHPDFGPSYGDGPDYGIPVTVVGKHRLVRVRFDYASESDRVRYPLGRDTRIEGGRRSDGDRHAIVVDRRTCRLYETFATRKERGTWRAGSGATWSLRSNALRPDGWTSADAAGLPILPGLLRWREVRDAANDLGAIDHAIRFTVPATSRHHLWPARHDAGSTDSRDYPPMGARFRLSDDFPTQGYGAHARSVIEAMQTYGLVLADNGSSWFFQGEQHRRWPSRLIEELKTIPASEFEAVDTSSLMVDPDSAQVISR